MLMIYYCIEIEGAESESLIMINAMLNIGKGIMQCLTRTVEPCKLAFESKT
jgi:hypothetical protein